MYKRQAVDLDVLVALDGGVLRLRRVIRLAEMCIRDRPITINNSPWFLQYSPYVYYNEHCIVLNSVHTPMKIDEPCFRKLMDLSLIHI